MLTLPRRFPTDGPSVWCGVATLLLVAWTSSGCQPPPGDDYIAPAAERPHADVPNHPLYRALLNEPLPSDALPEGVEAAAAKPNRLNETSLAHDAVGKVTYGLTGRGHKSILISYTVYPDSDRATAAFADIGTVPPSWNQLRAEKLTPTGLEGTVWGENSFERYKQSYIVRTSVATTADNAVALAQIINPGETLREGTSEDVLALLRVALQHVKALNRSSGDAAEREPAATATDSAATQSATPEPMATETPAP